MFVAAAQYYDLIYSFKDYASECEFLRRRIAEEQPSARTLLDAACGTGEHAKYLVAHFEVDGFDLQPEFIEIARAKVPSGRFYLGDMSHFDLERTYDVIVCLFSSIGYLTRPEQVVSALACFRKHLQPDGVVLLEPWFEPNDWNSGKLHMISVDRPEVKICRIIQSGRRGNVSILNFHYLIATPQGVEHVTEVHELSMYTRDAMVGFFRQAGFTVRFDAEGVCGRGLYVARPQ
jgi:SAM-dependent methyltransferase